jgi:hypothetical protein
MSYIPARASRTQTEEVEEVPDSYYNTRMPTSTRRYVDTRGNQVIQQGNRRVVIHKERAPSRRFHWMIFMGMVMFVMVLGWFIFTAIGYWWQSRQDDFKYGVPRTYQTDQFVGHADNPAHPDHFVAINTGGMIEVIEMNVLNPKYDHIYPITTSENPLTPVTLGFEDVNHDGKIDMLVIVGDTNPYTVVLLNNGTEFTH